MTKSTTRPMRSTGLLLLATLTVAIAGCGNSANITGKVTFAGRPVTHGSVIVVGPNKTARSGAILPDGTYMVEGIPPGMVGIAVISRDPAKGRSVVKRRPAEAEGTAASDGWVPLPAKYESPLSSGLGCTLGSGHTKHDIELK
jgi:hypothetical protein